MSQDDPTGEHPLADAGATEGRSDGGRALLPIFVGLFVVVAFAAGAWYALRPAGPVAGVGEKPPLVTADLSPIKEKPEDPGGLKIPDQDKMVYERLTPAPAEAEETKLAPPPESPVERPKKDTEAETAATSEASAEDGGKSPAAPSQQQTDTQATPSAPATTAEKEVPSPPPAAPTPDTDPKKSGTEPAPAKSAPETSETAAVASEKAPATAPAPTKPEAKASPKPLSQPETQEPKTRQVDPSSVYHVQLAAFRSTKAAQDGWRTLQKRHQEILGSYDAHVAKADLKAKGIYYRLQVGPISDEAAAREVCRRLKARKQDCLIVRPK